MLQFWTSFISFFKKIFMPKNWKRWLLLFFAIIGILITIICGSFFAISKKMEVSVEYGEGVKYQIEAKLKTENGKYENSNDKELTDISNSLKYRFASVNDFSTDFVPKGNGIIEVTRHKLFDNENSKQKKEFENAILKKSSFVFTDTEMRPIFSNGLFNNDPKAKIDYHDIEKYAAPLKPNSAKVIFNPFNRKYQIHLELKDDDAIREWTKAIRYISNTESHGLLMWANLDDLYHKANDNLYKDDWLAAGENAANFVFVNNTPWDNKNKKWNALKKFDFDGGKYLVSLGGDLNEKNFIIKDILDSQKSTTYAIASSINISSNKNLELKLHNEPMFYTKENSKFNFSYVWIAASIAIALIAIILIVCFGLLGALNSVALGLFVFLTLLLFTLLQGRFSPPTVTGLIVGIIVGTIVLFIQLLNFKNEVYKNNNKIKKSYKNAANKSFVPSLDIFILSLFVSTILFFIGTPNMQTFSLMVAFSSISGILSLILINRWLAGLMLNTDVFENNRWLLFVRKNETTISNKENDKFRKIDYVHKSKWISFITPLFVLIGIIIFITLSAINKNSWKSFNTVGIFAELSNTNINLEFSKFGISLVVILVALTLYSLVRFKWAITVSMIITLLINIVLTFSLFLITRIPLSSYSIQTFFWVILISCTNQFMIFNKIKEKIKLFENNSALEKKQVRSIANTIYVETFIYNLWTLAFIFIKLGIYLAFIKALDWETLLAFMLSSIFVLYSTMFISVSLWSKLEEKRQERIQRRIDTRYWVFPNEPSEQVFPGINNYLS
ncbi:hypothetical protein LAD73_01825 [Mycoplasma sp. 1331]|uniref:Protein export membrane protein SecD/SecF C-terminal domain-containing protein n=4 Tax=Mycoplasma tauri TaxID=547987 RepID=A0A953NEE5_9MOLU|nr:hypothetical protein [Mycoplasma tauri]MBZ4204490.1 hypothetical protein [Mycoplasma tauri]MBZ4218516.1 hypothetical protein [Mycoplasma tauri]MBZ4226874.1 hypothetical protein [Mycoplasma tauri]QSB07563.1 hypothetical protein JS510_00300 [Mycoplasma tauri]